MGFKGNPVCCDLLFSTCYSLGLLRNRSAFWVNSSQQGVALVSSQQHTLPVGLGPGIHQGPTLP